MGLWLGIAAAGVACGGADGGNPEDSGTGDAATTDDATPGSDTGTPRIDAPGKGDASTDAPGRSDTTVDPVDVRSDAGRDATGTPDSSVPRDTGSGQDTGAPSDSGARPDLASPQDAKGGTDAGGMTDSGSSADASRPGWNLVWSDEFNAASGAGVDTTKWNLVNKGDGFGNNELQFYTNRTTNAYHDGNGFLVIKAIKESYMGREYTSARLESNGKFERTYGRFEARMQLPQGQGIWPAFWMLGNDIGTAGWPSCGEIDIMENIGKEPSIVHGSLHGPGYSGGNPLGQAYTLPNAQKYADAFHTFAVEWEQNVVRFYMDDILYGTKTPSDTPSGTKWVYEHPFYLLLNVAVGGNWPGVPDGTTTFPQTLTIDYVRVYSR
ncbi:MAG: family 16 glycosylhydrolase [Polyangiaceae bacterium]